MSKWISVKDRLPGERVDVFIATDQGEILQAFIQGNGYLWNGRFCGWKGNVTHWMPLPEPPKDNMTIRLESLGYGDVDYKTSYNAGEATFS